MAISRAQLAKELEPGLNALFGMEYARYENQHAEIYTTESSDRAFEEEVMLSGFGAAPTKSEGSAVNFDDAGEAYTARYNHETIALAFSITEEAIEDNLYELNGGADGDLKELFHDLGEAMAENDEVLMARFLVNGAATTYHTTRDSKALFADDHPRLDGSTFDNKATSSDLTYSTFWANLIAAENQYNHRQYRIKKKVKNLWAPPQYEQKGLEILKSTDRPDTANRAISAYAASGRKIGLKVWPYLTDTDAHYFQLDGNGIIRFNRRKTRFAREKDFQTGDMMVKSDSRWSAEIQDPQGWYGVIPA